jgi:hypothetical protein
MPLLDAALLKYSGEDNYKHPKADYIHKIFGMTDAELENECESKIWLSAYAANNPRSDFHWQCDACYDAVKGREDTEIYKRAYEKISHNI